MNAKRALHTRLLCKFMPLVIFIALIPTSPARGQGLDIQAADKLKSQALSKLTAFSEKVKMTIQPDKLFYSTLRNGIVATVPAKGVESFNPQNSKAAVVDLGVVLLTTDVAAADGEKIPPGLYKARWVAPKGLAKGKAELLDEQGRTVAAVATGQPTLGEDRRRVLPAPPDFMEKSLEARQASVLGASRNLRQPLSVQYRGSSFTRCYGFLLFCCEARDPWFGGETICRWCGFCFGFWF
jgi:hypothetical protein